MLPRYFLPAVTVGVLCLASSRLHAQRIEDLRPVRAQALLAVENLKRFLGRPELSKFVEVSGRGGTPVPGAWRVVAHQASSPSAMENFLVRGRKVEPQGTNRQFYPDKTPEGFFEIHKVIIDSEEAFRIADRAAGLAKVGFDTLDYRLRAREFSDEPIWTVKLRNVDEELNGSVDISAASGKVLRTVWYYRDVTGHMLISDSAWPGGPRPAPRELRVEPAPLPPEPLPPPPDEPMPLEYEPQPPASAPLPPEEEPAPLSEPLDPEPLPPLPPLSPIPGGGGAPVPPPPAR